MPTDTISRTPPNAAPAAPAPTGGRRLSVIALGGFPLVRPGDDLAALVIAAIEQDAIAPERHDILVLAQKIVSKAEGRTVDLAQVKPSRQAQDLAVQAGKDARFVEAVLRESRRVVRCAQNVLIVEHRLGFIMANAGVDRSNVDAAFGAEPVLLLPEDPDASAAALCERLAAHFGTSIAVIISDSFGRPWRLGTVGVALGAAGLPALRDWRGKVDLHDRPLQATQTAFADEVAAAAGLLMGQADEGLPAVLVRGLAWSQPATPAACLLRPTAEDLFR